MAAITIMPVPIPGISPSFFIDARDIYIKAINVLLEFSDLDTDETTVSEVLDALNDIVGGTPEGFDPILEAANEESESGD